MQKPLLNDETAAYNHNAPSGQFYNPMGQNLFYPSHDLSSGHGQPNRLSGQESSGHCKSFLATIFLIIGAIIAFVVRVGDSTGISLLIFFAFYVIYIVVGCYNNELMNELDTITGAANFQTYYEQLRAATGIFAMDADCYHNETRTQERTVTDSQGNSKTQTSTYTVSVTTHTDHFQISPFFTQDESGRLQQFIANNEIVTIDFNVMYYHLDSQSERKLEQVYTNFRIKNTKDDFQKFTIKYTIPNMILKKAFTMKEISCEYSCWFYIFAMVGLIWPYSLWVESHIDRFEVKLIKAIQF